jgi:hypothetical protein
LIVPPIDNNSNKGRAQEGIQCVPIHIQRSRHFPQPCQPCCQRDFEPARAIDAQHLPLIQQLPHLGLHPFGVGKTWSTDTAHQHIFGLHRCQAGSLFMEPTTDLLQAVCTDIGIEHRLWAASDDLIDFSCKCVLDAWTHLSEQPSPKKALRHVR